MLSFLTIQNVVLIERLTISFQAGLCALTGETGAGKSILLDSLGLATGARAESRLVRKGADQAMVTAVFELPFTPEESPHRRGASDSGSVDPRLHGDAQTSRDARISRDGWTSRGRSVLGVLNDADIMIEDGEPLMLKRTLTPDGRSRAFINDQPVSAGLLKQVGEMLVEIHGQFDTHGLLNPATHGHMLDEYAGINGDIAGLWQDWKGAEEHLRILTEEAAQVRADEEYLRQSLEDLDALAPEEGEEKSLSETRERLRYKEQALKALGDAYYELNSDKDPVSKALKVLDQMADKLPESAGAAIDALDRAMSEIEEARSVIGSVREDLWHDDQDLETVDDRLHALKAQARKHNCMIDELPAKREEIAGKLNTIEHQDTLLVEAARAVEAARKAYALLAETLSAQRQAVAEKLDRLVMAELPPLKLEKARFVTVVDVLPEDEWGPQGMNRVRFLVATNPGSEPGPLGKIASGGEMARFMLALKVVMAGVGSACTLVFDEVDAGVGGAVADAVGDRLARVAQEGKQVMVVTHAPQIAAKAGAHFIVRKDGETQVNTNVVQLSEAAERREEIARMLAGATITEEARAAAEKLMEVG